MRTLIALSVVSLVAATGCSPESAPNNEVDIATAADAARGSVDNYAALPDDKPAPRQAVASQAPTPQPTASTAPATSNTRDADSAAAVVRRYYESIGAGRYEQAWRLWGGDGQASEMSQEAFAASFAKYADYRAEVGAPGRLDAGAGQRYVTVPVRISGRLKDGDRPFVMAGPVTLHRVADIDGATSAQRNWRISASGVRPRPDEAASASGPETPGRATAR